MDNGARSAQIVRFGMFEADLEAGELRKNGLKIPLQDQPFQVCAILLKHSGKLVTRDELRKELWPEDTFVDFDHGLNTAITKIRNALGDSAENSRFVETLPRKGYRFIVPLQEQPKADTATPVKNTEWRTRKLILIGGAILLGTCAVLFALNVGGWRDAVFGKPPLPHIQSLAVLPFANLSGDPDKEYFADGMTDSLITELGKVHAVRVISHQSVMQYKGSRKTIPQIARELKVDAMVEGTVIRDGERVRITAQLIGISPERHLWANSFERDVRDILTLQSVLSQAIAAEINVQLAPQEKRLLSNTRTVNPEAYDLCLKGSYCLYKDNSEGFLKAIEYFEEALDLDKTYAPAYAGLSTAYSTAALYGVLPFQDALPKAKVAAKRALELDESLAEAHVSLAAVMGLYDRDWAGADRESERALELAPNNMLAHSWYGKYLTDMGRFDEAIAIRRHALEIDPLSIPANDFLGWTLYYAGHYDESIRQYRKLIEIEPNNAYFYAWISGSYLATRDSAAALAACQKALDIAPVDQFVLTWCGHHLAVLGRREEALVLLERVKALSGEKTVDPYLLAYLYDGLGDKERVLKLLERAFKERSPNMANPAGDFSPAVTADPRFQDLLRRMNFPKNSSVAFLRLSALREISVTNENAHRK
jgi:TolB-like protein/DNA-binding winged helix-turn-helix (wHTH) protein/Flp pilus assembly protein TadD